MKAALLLALLSAAAGPTTRPAEPAPTTPPEAGALRQQLWRTHTGSLQTTGAAASLEQEIQRLNSVRLATTRPADPRPTSCPATMPAPVAAAGRAESRPDPLAKLEPSKTGNPLAVAEALAAAGALDKAADFFAAAAAGEGDPEERSWLLYRSATCLRTSDAPRALKVYDELAAAAPQSLWADVARQQKAVLEWQQANRVAAEPPPAAAGAATQPATRPAGAAHD